MGMRHHHTIKADVRTGYRAVVAWRRRATRAGASVVAAAALVGLGACATPDQRANTQAAESASPSPTEPETMNVAGSLYLNSGSRLEYGKGRCVGADGYEDLTEGAQVTIYNSTGQKIALGSLDQGLMVENPGPTASCRFDFYVSDVPAEDTIYSVEVTHRGTVDFTKDEATDIQLSLDD